MSPRLLRARFAAPVLVAASLGPACAEELLLNVKAPVAEPTAEAVPASINLGGGFIEFLLTGRIAPAPRIDPAPIQPATVPAAAVRPAGPAVAEAPDGDVTIVDYSGPFEPGSVILNVTKKQVYRILAGGKLAIYTNDQSQIRLARAILKQTGR
ncbi:hypothetical protein [Methylobacterium sp. Gmos1]